MVLYRDVKTGALISSECELSGDWVLADEVEKKVEAVEKELTVPELKSRLTELGVEFDEKAKKADLLKLLQAQGD